MVYAFRLPKNRDNVTDERTRPKRDASYAISEKRSFHNAPQYLMQLFVYKAETY